MQLLLYLSNLRVANVIQQNHNQLIYMGRQTQSIFSNIYQTNVSQQMLIFPLQIHHALCSLSYTVNKKKYINRYKEN